ncbi:hypothetical protein JXZ92_00050 [Mycoplasma sp. CSL10137]|uniref:hypothetical protein n=1 Tax=unclassified Mycoplasma TaxID=2683645 RepID=UPI00197B3DD9|nr:MULTISPECIES: hypothetical protein [unclassified Mycoplasma]MBN4083214.1 hypothetical protein [Mycoplasma sp. CSL10137]MBN4084490.1 hypothetical protein [Mycoplasma sp. CSL10166]MBU4692969.1 hypothetical protein [Mycoplasma sp. CSL7491-lung]
MNRECNKRACREASASNTMETREEKVYEPVGGVRCEDEGIANKIANQLLEDKKHEVIEQTRVGYQEKEVDTKEENLVQEQEEIILQQNTSEQVYQEIQQKETRVYDLLDVLAEYKDFLQKF